MLQFYKTDSDILDYLNYDLGIEDVFKMYSEGGVYYSINPEFELFGEDDGEPVGQYYAIGLDGSDIDNDDIGLTIGGMNEEGQFYLDIMIPEEFDTPFIVVMYDGTWMNKKALVIYPN